MSNDTEINEWAADKCGVIHGGDVFGDWWTKGSVRVNRKFDYLDPRCMAVIRGHFILHSSQTVKGWLTVEHKSRTSPMFGKGDNPHEADCACLVKIWEASNE